MKRPDWLHRPRFAAGGHITHTPPPGKPALLSPGEWECRACGHSEWGTSWSDTDSAFYAHARICPARTRRSGMTAAWLAAKQPRKQPTPAAEYHPDSSYSEGK